MLDPYAVLGLGPDADEAAIRAAYRRLARQFHPDVNRAPGAATRMREINAAYELLEDPERRSAERASVSPASAQDPRPAASTTRSAYRRPAHDAARPSAGGAGASRWGPASAAATPASAPYRRMEPSGPRVQPVSPVAAPASAPSTSRLSAGTIAGMAGAFAVAGVFAIWMVAGSSGGRATSAAAPSRSASFQTESVSVGRNASSGIAGSQGGITAASVASTNLAGARDSRDGQPPLQPLSISNVGGVSVTAPSLPSLKLAESVSGVTAPVSPSAPIVASVVEPQVPVAAAEAVPAATVATASASANSQRRAATAAGQNNQVTQPVAPVSAAGGSQPATHIQSIASQQVMEPATAAGATRALSTYDKAWNSYVMALRVSAAGSLAGASGTVRTTSSAAAFLSSDGQLGLSRALYLDAQLAWSRQMSTTLSAAGASAAASRPDGDKAARAELRLRQAAELVSQAQAAGLPVPAAQVKTLLDEADQLHRASVQEWATFLGQL